MTKMYEYIYTMDGSAGLEYVVGKSEKDVCQRYDGEAVRVKDVTQEFPISESAIEEALKVRFGNAEINAVLSIMRRNYANMVN
ncbi:MAG: hypothetical protein FWB80_04480 [Defluviitaleaceae bacterium]|nr:hypothetical protein [Defluviitaleaceae bacterium]